VIPMPNIQSAKKKVRKDIKAEKRNAMYEKSISDSVKKVTKAKTAKDKKETVQKAYSVIDKAAKKNVIHNNKASRLKSKVSKLVAKA
jgi:small subunit ribosomal protein S20